MDFERPIQIAKNTYWVGMYLINDPFQCHPYLIVNGDESILIDPGSMLEFEHVIKKTKELIDLKQIKYIIIHHQDPDIAASVPSLEKLIDRKDLQIITHSRMVTLLKHYEIRSKYYKIDTNNYELSANNLKLKFVTTPYCHSPGAFVSYDVNTKVLFSSDIFGGLEESWSFYADENYFEQAKLFHQEYMPSRNIFNYTLQKIEKLDIELIAPQHGSIIKKQFINKLIEDMKGLNCGLYIEKKYHEELLDVIDRLEQEIEENRKKDRIIYSHAKNSQMSEMLNMIAHQWRQPLNAISASSINVSLKNSLNVLESEKLQQEMKYIQDMTQQMSQSINEFMDFIQPQKDKHQFTTDTIKNSINSIIGPQLKNLNINLLYSPEKELQIYSYKQELENILLNIISNARDAYLKTDSDNKTIYVDFSIENDILIIKVSDNAGGISSEIIDKIYNPYFTTQAQGKSEGIGLYMVKRTLNEVFDGEISAENIKNGTLFTVKIPLKSGLE